MGSAAELLGGERRGESRLFNYPTSAPGRSPSSALRKRRSGGYAVSGAPMGGAGGTGAAPPARGAAPELRSSLGARPEAAFPHKQRGAHFAWRREE